MPALQELTQTGGGAALQRPLPPRWVLFAGKHYRHSFTGEFVLLLPDEEICQR